MAFGSTDSCEGIVTLGASSRYGYGVLDIVYFLAYIFYMFHHLVIVLVIVILTCLYLFLYYKLMV
jgi:hypothetical protein